MSEDGEEERKSRNQEPACWEVSFESEAAKYGDPYVSLDDASLPCKTWGKRLTAIGKLRHNGPSLLLVPLYPERDMNCALVRVNHSYTDGMVGANCCTG
jgi:hypothetical protein